MVFYLESIPNEGQRSQGKNFGKQAVECFVYDEEGCQGTVPFPRIRVHLFLANQKAGLMDRSKGFQWFYIQAIFVGDCEATTISQAVASSYCSDQATNKMVP